MARISAVLLLLFVLSGALFAISVNDTLAVSVREGELRSSPGFLSAITARVQYGESVKVTAKSGDWVRVRVESSGEEGWVHSSSVLPPREMNLAGSTGRDTGTTSREIALAGRGFNEQVEQEYKDQQDLDFSEVDEMETRILPLSELGAFLSEVDATIEEAE